MINTDELVERCEAALRSVPAGAEAIVSTSAGNTTLTRFANSVIHQNHAEDSVSTFCKVILDGRYASASTTFTDEEALRRLVDRAVAAAKLRPPDPDWPGLAGPAAAPGVEHWDDETAAADPSMRADVVAAFVEAGEGLSGAGYCSSSATVTAFANTAGQRLVGRSTAATIDGIQRTDVSDGVASQSSARLADLDGRAAGELAASRARAAQAATDAEPGTYEVVLDPSCLANMCQFLAMSGFNGKPVADGTSFVHLGEAQFDERVSMWDDATDPRTLGMPFDNEGTPKRPYDLVRNGVTVGIVHDRRTARRSGVESTGHSMGQEAFGAYPSNLFVGTRTPPGDGASVDDLIAQVERGLYVCDFWYTRILDPKTQVVTGLTRNGVFRIEGGKLGGAAKNLRFTQSFVGALGPGHVLGMADDGRLVGSMHVPSVRLSAWNFTGGTKG